MSTKARRRKAESKQAAQKPPVRKIERVKFKYIFPETYNPVYANGAYGGPTTMGEIAINFYIERHPVPLEDTHALAEDGRVAEQLERVPQPEDKSVTIIRYLTTGVLLNYESAKRIHDWLGRHLEQMESARAGVQAIAKASKK